MGIFTEGSDDENQNIINSTLGGDTDDEIFIDADIP